MNGDNAVHFYFDWYGGGNAVGKKEKWQMFTRGILRERENSIIPLFTAAGAALKYIATNLGAQELQILLLF